MNVVDRYYLRMEPEGYAQKVSGSLAEVIDRTTRRARKRTSARVFEHIMEPSSTGALRLRESPPVLQHLDLDDESDVVDSVREYLTGLRADVALLLPHFQITDVAQRVFGVGSVGTRCYLVILTGADGTPLILQVKEANRSVLDEYGEVTQPESLVVAVNALGQGERVIAGQRVLQATSDVFLGVQRLAGRDFYVRQFQDMKGTIETDAMSPKAFGQYVSACGLSLARGHTQSANASLLHGYVGNGNKVGAAIIEWSYAYADKSLDDFHQLHAAAKAGEIAVADDPAR